MVGQVTKGTEPTQEELTFFKKEKEFYLQWAREGVKTSIALANDILKQLVTLNTALLGGTVVFLEKDMIDEDAKAAVVVLFFLALIISFLGMLPYESRPSEDMYEIKNEKAKALQHKRWFLWSASACTALGFGIAIASFLV